MLKRLALAFALLLAPVLAFAQAPPPVPVIPDANRYDSFSPVSSTSVFNVSFPVFGSCEDLTVQLNGAPLTYSSQWTCASASGTPLANLPLPITDMQVTLVTPISSGFLEIIGNWQPRRTTQPTNPAINRYEMNESLSTVIAGMRELHQQELPQYPQTAGYIPLAPGNGAQPVWSPVPPASPSTAPTNEFANGVDAGGHVLYAQPSASNLSNGTTGTGSVVLSNSPALTTPNLGTPSAADLLHATDLPISTGVSGLGTNVAADAANAVNGANGFVAPSSATNLDTLCANGTTWSPCDAILPEVGQFGAIDRTGAADDTATFQAAANNAVNGAFRINPGTYLINGTVTDSKTNCSIEFSGPGVTIKSGSATGDVFSLSGAHCSFGGGEPVQFTHAVARTSGADIHCSSVYCHVGPIYDAAPFWGVELDAGATLAYVQEPWCRAISTTNGATCVRIGVTGSTENPIIVKPFCDVDNTASIPTACILDDDSDALQIDEPNLIHGGVDILLAAGNGQTISSTTILGGFLDTPLNNALELETSGTGNVYNVKVVGTWLGDATTLAAGGAAAINLVQSGTGVLAGFECDSCVIPNNPTGVTTSGSVSSIRFIGGCSAANTTAFALGAITDFSVQGMKLGNCANLGANTTAFSFFGTLTGADISHNNMSGSTTKFTTLTDFDSTSRVESNIGYNPVGSSGVTVTASPFSYTSGPSPETEYLNNSAALTITQGGNTVCFATSCAVELGPNETMSVAYSAGSPTMTKVIH